MKWVLHCYFFYIAFKQTHPRDAEVVSIRRTKYITITFLNDHNTVFLKKFEKLISGKRTV